MPVSLNDMMRKILPANRAEIERNASAVIADVRQRADHARLPASKQSTVGTKAATGQPCPATGIWKVENTTSATAPIAIDTAMPLYGDQAVTWVLVQYA